jgi:D-amino-acid oxidase
MTDHAIIAGSGVIGLSCALELVSSNRKIGKLTIVSDYFPDDGDTPPLYASTRAGAHWRPMAEDGNEFKQRRRFEAETYQVIMGQLNRGNTFDGTISKMRALDYYDVHPRKRLWWTKILENYKKIAKKSLPDGVQYGIEYTTFTIDAPKYIQYLLREIKDLAAKRGIVLVLERRIVETIGSLHISYPNAIVINATGTGSLKIDDVKDQKCYVSRGQVILVENQASKIDRTLSRIRENGVDYVIPRPNNGGVILGGCNWINSYYSGVDEELSNIIKKNVCAMDPIMGKPEDFKVIKTSVGLRPMRVGGPRVEIDSERPWLIHAYGLGGAGFQSSRGVAQLVGKLFDRASQSTRSKL